MSEVQFNDPVLNAFAEFEKAGFTYGNLIQKEWFYRKFNLPLEVRTPQEAEDVKMLYCRHLGALRTKLLCERQMALRTKDGVGQEVVKPEEQTEWAVQDFVSDIYRLTTKAADRLTHVNLAELSNEQRRENSDAVAKLSFFRSRGLKALSK